MTGLHHPLVQDYLARLDQASANLPPDVRAELGGDIASHLDSAVTPTSTDADVRNTLQELGAPEDVAAAAYADLAGTTSAGAWTQPVPPSAPGYPAPAYQQAVPPPSPWGAVEIIAVLGLTAGTVVLPVVGPIVGLVMAWVSERWTRREKVVATVLTALPLVAFVLIVLGVFAISGSSDEHFDQGAGTPTHSGVLVDPHPSLGAN